jgi:hypothetical protein
MNSAPLEATGQKGDFLDYRSQKAMQRADYPSSTTVATATLLNQVLLFQISV